MALSAASTTLGTTLDAAVAAAATAQAAYDARITALTASLQTAIPALTQAQATGLARTSLQQAFGPPAWRAALQVAISEAMATWADTVLGADA
jgi:hypothetical protein